MRSFWRRQSIHLGLVGFSLLAAGCHNDPDIYRAETEIEADGAIIRAIYQPAEKTPERARDPKLWKQVTFAPAKQPDALGWPATLIDLPPHGRDDNHTYLVARQEFRSAADIPEHISFKEPDIDAAPSTLKHTYERVDYGLVVEHRWTETLTDCVSLEDMRLARDESLALGIDLAEDTLPQLFGDEYDFSGLARWARTEGSAWAVELSELLLARSLQPRSARFSGKAEFELNVPELQALANACARHGLLLTKNGQLMTKEDATKAIESFGLDLLQKHLRRKDGRPLDRKEVLALVEKFERLDESQGDNSPVKAAIHKAEERRGGREVVELRSKSLFTRVVGHFWFRIFEPASRFDYALTMPGKVVETNGQILSARKVRWRFEAGEAFPLGYAMRCRSLAVDPVANAIAPGDPLASRSERLEFVSTCVGEEKMIEALRACRVHQSLAPLHAYRKEVLDHPERLKQGELPTALARRVDRLFELLKQGPRAR